MVLQREEGGRTICRQIGREVSTGYSEYVHRLHTCLKHVTYKHVFTRFGKVLWRNVPEDVLDCSWGIEKFADLCFSDTRHSRIFNTK